MAERKYSILAFESWDRIKNKKRYGNKAAAKAAKEIIRNNIKKRCDAYSETYGIRMSASEERRRRVAFVMKKREEVTVYEKLEGSVCF